MKHDTEACLLCLTPQCLLFVLCFAISRWKRIILCFQLIFLYCAQRPPKPAARIATPDGFVGGENSCWHIRTSPPKHSSCKASVFLHSNMLRLSCPLQWSQRLWWCQLWHQLSRFNVYFLLFFCCFFSSYVHVSILWGRRRWWITVHFIGSQIKVLNFEHCVLTRLYL